VYIPDTAGTDGSTDVVDDMEGARYSSHISLIACGTRNDDALIRQGSESRPEPPSSKSSPSAVVLIKGSRTLTLLTLLM
jgi:hypothetical protein